VETVRPQRPSEPAAERTEAPPALSANRFQTPEVAGVLICAADWTDFHGTRAPRRGPQYLAGPRREACCGGSAKI